MSGDDDYTLIMAISTIIFGSYAPLL